MTPKAKFLSYTAEYTNMKHKFNMLIKEVEPDVIGQDALWWQSTYLADIIPWVFSSAYPLPESNQQLTITTVMYHK